MSNDRINIGDRVNVVFGHEGHQEFGVVLYMPQVPGDCWIIRSLEDDIIYVGTYLYIRKL